MAYTKQFEIKINGSSLHWLVDVQNGKTKIKNDLDFELTTEQLREINELLNKIVYICKICPDIHSFEYSDY